MATDRDDKSEKGPRSKAGSDNPEIDRETRPRSADYDDDYDDLGTRARQNARDFGDSVREAGRSVRREGNDLFTGYCDLIGGIFTGIGEALSPGGRSSSGNAGRANPCAPITTCVGANRSAGGGASRASGSGGGATTSRAEARRPR